MDISKNIEGLIEQISDYVESVNSHELSKKSKPTSWSKKEILGHLIDSGLNNLQRFTEIQFNEKPYRIKTYKQEELVKANNYQNAEVKDILALLRALNKRLLSIIKLQSEENLEYKIIGPNGEKFNLRFLIEDYLIHFEHHSKQIILV